MKGCRVAAAALLAFSLTGAVGVAAAAPLAASAGPAGVSNAEEEPNCIQVPPEHVPSLAQTAKPLVVRARVVVEHADLALAQAHMRGAAKAYAQRNITLVVRWDTPSRFRIPASADGRTADPALLIDALKKRYRGVRPPGTDLVYLFSPQTAGGLADCIGGVLHPSRAFAVGGLQRDSGPTLSATGALIAAHEIGHLLGAHHHYANCHEPLAAGSASCTIMFPEVRIASLRVGVVEAAFMRDTLLRRS